MQGVMFDQMDELTDPIKATAELGKLFDTAKEAYDVRSRVVFAPISSSIPFLDEDESMRAESVAEAARRVEDGQGRW
jgi:hypothetical protein